MSKEVKEKFLQLKIEEGKDWKYFKSTTDEVFLIDNYMYTIDKPRIRRNFCFSYGMNCQSTVEEQQEAQKQRDKAQTSYNFFMQENLEAINSKINKIKYFLSNREEQEELISNNKVSYNLQFCKPFITYKYYTNKYEVSLSFMNEDEAKSEKKCGYIIREATETDLNIILSEYIKARERFIKRLNTYLKKYGLSKVYAWTYLVD